MFGADIRDYQLESVLTQCCGGIAVVYAAIHKPSRLTVAIKKFHLDKAKENASLIQQEILTTRQLQHQNVLPYLSTFVNGLDLYIVAPLMSYGSCRDIINKYYSEGLPELASCIILRDVLQGLDYIHSKGYIHRGIRSSHILVCGSGNVCLSGLRSAGSLVLQGKRQKSLHCLPPPCHNNSSLIWLSPELLEQNLKGYDEKSDIYSIGMVGCELGNGAIPFSDIPTTLMLTEKVRGHTPHLLDATTFPQIQEQEECDPTDNGIGDIGGSSNVINIRQMYATRRFSDSFHEFTEICLLREPSMRPTPAQLLQHSFFKQIRKSDSLPQILQIVKVIDSRSETLPASILEDQMNEMNIESPCEWDF